MRKNSPIKLTRKLHADGKWFYLCHIIEENRFYFVYNHESLTNFAAAMTTQLSSWSSETPWDVVQDETHEPEDVMTSSYEETVNYLKVNVLIGVI